MALFNVVTVTEREAKKEVKRGRIVIFPNFSTGVINEKENNTHGTIWFQPSSSRLIECR